MAPHGVLLQALAFLHLVLAVALVLDLLRQHRSASATLAWIAILLLLPWLGILVYLLAGAPRKRSAALAGYLARHAGKPAAATAAASCPADGTGTERLLRALGLPPATDGNRVRLCSRNDDAAAALLELVRGARERLLLSVFSFEADSAGRPILEAMCERAAAGVQVCMLVDGYGSANLRAPDLQALLDAGGRLARHRPLLASATLRGAFNQRNHRKMMIADGRAAWVGGRNLARKYLEDFEDGSQWTDLSLVIEGPAAAVFESVFWSDWLTAGGVAGAADHVPLAGREAHAGGSWVQVLPSGPDLPDDTLHAMLLAGIIGARQRVWIVSPYFVPDDALHSALRLACRRGLDVRIVVPRHSNMALADRVRASFLAELGAAGASVRLFEATVVHSKIVVFDDRVAVVGSANFDMRSLFTNHEVAAVLYSPADVAAVAALVDSYAARSVQAAPPARFATTALSGALRIIAPLL